MCARRRGSIPVGPRSVRGVTLIDALVLIAVLGVLAAGNSLLMSRLAVASAQANVELQSLQFAAGLLSEVSAMPFTYCDADDTQAATAQLAVVGPTGCASTVDALGPEGAESRYAAPRFDHVGDWAGLVMPGPGCAGLCDASGGLLAGGVLSGCSARVTVAPQAWGGIAAVDAQSQAQVLRIRVTLACPGQADLVLEALRVRDAPNLL